MTRTWLSQPVFQNGGSNRSRVESALILRLRLQLELAKTEKEMVQAKREMMRERVELEFQGEAMRDAGAFAAKSLPEIKFQRWLKSRMMEYELILNTASSSRVVHIHHVYVQPL